MVWLRFNIKICFRNVTKLLNLLKDEKNDQKKETFT